MINPQKKEILGKDLEVALQIFDYSGKKKEDIYFSKLVRILDGRISRNRISQALDRLFDIGIVTAEFKKVGKSWARVYYISGEAESFMNNLYDQVIED